MSGQDVTAISFRPKRCKKVGLLLARIISEAAARTGTFQDIPSVFDKVEI